MLQFTIQNERESQRKCSLTVTVSKHNAGVLPTQLQSHSLQITFGCRFFYQLAYLHEWVYTANTIAEIILTAKSYKPSPEPEMVCKVLHAVWTVICVQQGFFAEFNWCFNQRNKGVTVWFLVNRYSPNLFIASTFDSLACFPWFFVLLTENIRWEARKKLKEK